MRSWGPLTEYNRAASTTPVENLDDTALGLYAATEYGLLWLFCRLAEVIPAPTVASRLMEEKLIQVPSQQGIEIVEKPSIVLV